MSHGHDLLVISAIVAEIRTGRTFAYIALTSRDKEKTARNTVNALKAYNTARVWVEQALLTPEDFKDISDQLAQLKAELTKLNVANL